MRFSRVGSKTWMICTIVALALLFVFTLNLADSYWQYILMTIPLLGMVVYGFIYRISFVLYLLFFIIPLSSLVHYQQGVSISMPSELLISLVSLYAVFLFLKKENVLIFKKILLHPLSVLILVNTLILIITTATSTMLDVSVKRTLMRLNFLLVGFFFIVFWMRNKQHLLKPAFFYGLGIGVVAIFTLVAHADYQFKQGMASFVCPPFFDDHTIYGSCLAFILPSIVLLCANPLKSTPILKLLMRSLLLVIPLALYFSFSRGAWLSLLATLLLYFLLKLKTPVWMFVAMVITFSSVGFVFKNQLFDSFGDVNALSQQENFTQHISSIANMKSDLSNVERLNRWHSAVEMFREKPITGYGFGTYQFQYAPFQNPTLLSHLSSNNGDKGNAHSEYLTYLSETGIFGFLSFICMLGYTLYLGVSLYYKQKDPALKNIALVTTLGLFTFVVHGFFNAFLDQDKMALLVFSSMAILVAIDLFHTPILTHQND
jgi:putative inorganic carbon (HCO3(-)) transporter